MTVEIKETTRNLPEHPDFSSQIDKKLDLLENPIEAIVALIAELTGLDDLFAEFMKDANLTDDQITPERFAEFATQSGVELTPAQSNIFGWSAEACNYYGLPGSVMSILFGLFKTESGFRTAAANPTSSARGLGQFLTSTWEGYIKNNRARLTADGKFTGPELDNPNARTENPRLMVFMTVAYIKKSYDSLREDGLLPQGWQTPNAGEMIYICHHLGHGDGPKFIRYRQTHNPAILASMAHPDIAQNSTALYAKVGRRMEEYDNMFSTDTTSSNIDVA